MVQVANILFQKLYEESLLAVEVGGNCFSKVPFYRGDSFFPVFIGNGLIHFVVPQQIDHLARVDSMVRGCQELPFC